MDYVLVNLGEGVYVGQFEKEISISNSFMTEALEVFLGKEFKDGKSTDSIIKVFLPSDYNKAMEVLDYGIEYNGVRYVELLSTPSSMKKEGNIDEIDYKLEMIFIK